ncbi:unnamed protein product [Anisakis simplex]|uniref:Uncharacterized protein n=1 Tax=Anisakis simplex TaxID=6269 RepID=A0A3P6T1I0_ANISI|nr:unnamed protein product [Anisakis simplex]
MLLSKYEKQIDSRDFAERRAVFENKNAFPCFPNVPPPPTVYEKVVAPESGVKKSRKKPGKRKLTMFELYELCDALSPTSAHPKGTTLRDGQLVLDENEDPSAQIIDENDEGKESSEGEED